MSYVEALSNFLRKLRHGPRGMFGPPSCDYAGVLFISGCLPFIGLISDGCCPVTSSLAIALSCRATL